MPTFDLRDEKWIPVLTINGESREVGLRDLLHEAHELREIRDPLPTVEFGLYRLLTALVLDIFGLQGNSSLKNLLDTKQFDRAKVDKYFAENADRFDLFHPKYPFLQTSGMDGESAKPLAGLLPPTPSGTNAAHFHHAHENELAVSPAAAARLLTTIAPFMTAGGAGLAPSINGAPAWYVLISRPGQNLFETLCLNCYVTRLNLDNENATPAWRRNRPVEAKQYENASLLESLTWQPRRVQLIPGAGGLCSLTCKNSDVLVRTMKFAPGASSRFTWIDPAIAYRESKDGRTPLRPQEGRAVWRDTGPLALLQKYEMKDGRILERARLIDQFIELRNEGRIPKRASLKLTLYGMRTYKGGKDQKMKVFEWQREELILPEELILQGRFHIQAQEAMEQADSVAYAIKQAIKRSYPRDGKGNKGAFDSLIAGAQRQFWAELRDPYDAVLRDIAPLSPEEDIAKIADLRKGWEAVLRDTGRDALHRAIDDLDTDADALKRQTEALRLFRTSLYLLFETPEQKAARTVKKAKTSEAKKGAKK